MRQVGLGPLEGQLGVAQVHRGRGPLQLQLAARLDDLVEKGADVAGAAGGASRVFLEAGGRIRIGAGLEGGAAHGRDVGRGLEKLRVVAQGQFLQIGQRQRPSLRHGRGLRVGAERRQRRKQLIQDFFSLRIVFIRRQLDAWNRAARQQSLRNLQTIALEDAGWLAVRAFRRLGRRRLVGRRQGLRIDRLGRRGAYRAVDRVAHGVIAAGRQDESQRRDEPAAMWKGHRLSLLLRDGRGAARDVRRRTVGVLSAATGSKR